MDGLSSNSLEYLLNKVHLTVSIRNNPLLVVTTNQTWLTRDNVHIQMSVPDGVREKKKEDKNNIKWFQFKII